MTVIDSSTTTHVCPKCQQEKPLTREFFGIRHRYHRDAWRTDACRECIKANARASDAIREKAKIRMRELRATPEGRIAHNSAMRKWKAENPKKRHEERRKYFEKQGKQYSPRYQYSQQQIEQAYDQIIEQNARDAFKWWFAKKSDAEVKAWYAATGKPWLNPRLSDTDKYRLQYKLDHEFAIYERMRRQIKKAANRDGVATLIWGALKRGGESKTVEETLGYTINDLRVHLERQFTKGMNWDKFMKGEIHIDHIHPKASFNLSDPDEWRVCWSLPNLRPLWAKDNLEKRDKIFSLL